MVQLFEGKNASGLFITNYIVEGNYSGTMKLIRTTRDEDESTKKEGNSFNVVRVIIGYFKYI